MLIWSATVSSKALKALCTGFNSDGLKLRSPSLPTKLEGVEFGRESRANVPRPPTPPICQNIT